MVVTVFARVAAVFFGWWIEAKTDRKYMANSNTMVAAYSVAERKGHNIFF